MKKIYVERMFRKLNFDNLYIGIITICKSNNGIFPSFITVDIPDDVDSIQYLAIVEKCGDGYYQVDNGQLCLESDNCVLYDSLPRICHPVKLSDFYRACYGTKSFPFSKKMIKPVINKVLNDAKKKALVINNENNNKSK